jgi:hypothetical protein
MPGLILVAMFVLALLKAIGIINISWLTVIFAPMLIGGLIFLLIIVVVLIGAALASMFE